MSPVDSPFAPLPAPGPHPATAELRAYAAGTLPAAEEHRIEAHTLECERCADVLEGFSMTDAATTDQSIAALRSRLRSRVVPPESVPTVAHRAWPRVAAAAALLAIAAGGVWTLERPSVNPAPPAARREAATSASPLHPSASPEAMATTPSPAPATTPTPSLLAPKKAAYAAGPLAAARRLGMSHSAHRPRKSITAAALVRPSSTNESGVTNTPLEGEIASASPVAAEQAASQPAVAGEPTIARAEPASKPGYQTQDKTLAADALITARQEVAARFDKVRNNLAAAPASAAAALVANTPMPATLAINPAPVGGTPAFRDYLRREATKFEPEEGKPLSGTVRLTFVVEADGQVSRLQVTRGLRADYDAEALRMVCEGPAWQPGINGGRRAPLPMEVSVSF